MSLLNGFNVNSLLYVRILLGSIFFLQKASLIVVKKHLK